MKPFFTIHAGEYLTGEFIEQKLRDPNGNRLNLWVPAKDTGVDLLVTDHLNKNTTALQIKFSKDYLIGLPKEHQEVLVAGGWWTLNKEKIINSTADYWIFVLHGFTEKKMNYVILTPAELIKKIDHSGKKGKNIQIYLTITKSKKCFQTRGLKKAERNELFLNDAPIEKERDFTEYLNNWKQIFTNW